MLESLRYLLVTLLFLLVSFFALFRAILRPFDPSSTIMAARVFGRLSNKILGIKVEIEGAEFLKTQGPVIIISNHQDNMDVVPMAQLMPDRTVTVGKRSLVYIPFFGVLYWLTGNILIKRENRVKAVAAMDKVAQEIVKRQISVWIMPEGTRSRGRGLLPFKKGAFFTAIKAQVPLLPICINSYHHNLKLNHWHSGTIRIKVLPPIDPRPYSVEQVNELLQVSYNAIKAGVEALDAKKS